MSVTFKNAPLVELIAELHWGDSASLSTPGLPVAMQGMTPELDQFFMRLSGELYQHGFKRAERMVPAGFPVFPQQPVYRFRKDATDDNSILFQSGPGLFSIHAIPPYHSWEKVSSLVETGVAALLRTRSSSEENKPFTRANLRYINAFGPKLTQGRSVANFVEEVLGFSVLLPDAVSRHIKVNSTPKPHLQFSFPLTNAGSMSLLVAEGNVNNTESIILDMTIISSAEIKPDLSALMDVFTGARSIIHETFIGLTKPIHNILEPVQEDAHA